MSHPRCSMPLFSSLVFCVATGVTFAASPSATDPRTLATLLEASTTSSAERANALQRLTAMGSAAQPAVPQLCRLLTRNDPSADGQSTLGQQIARVLAHVGIDAGNAAVAMARSDLAAVGPNSYPTTDWLNVLANLGAAGVPAMADALSDQHTLVAMTACQALRLDLIMNQRDPMMIAALTKIGPKLALGWTRSVAVNPDQKSQQNTADQPFVQQQQQREKKRWLEDVIEIADLSGPATFDSVATAAGAYAKQHRASPETALASVKELVQAIAAAPPKQVWWDSGVDKAMKKVIDCQSGAIAPLADVIARNDQSRDLAITALNSVISTMHRGIATDPLWARHALMRCLPPSALPLDQHNRTEMAKIIPILVKVSADIHPDPQHDLSGSALSILINIAPDVPTAAAALIEGANRVQDTDAPGIGDALGRCDAATRKKLNAVAHTPVGLDIALRARVHNLPPKQAAAEIVTKVPPKVRGRFLNDLNSLSSRAEIVPLLIELLTDDASNSLAALKTSYSPETTPLLLAALDRPEPQIRSAVFICLPERAITSPVISKAADSLGDQIVSQAAEDVLIKAGPAAFPSLIELTQNKLPAIRCESVTVIGNLPDTIYFEAATLEERFSLAEAVLPLWDDADVSVRAAALKTTARFWDTARPAVMEKIKRADDDQRIHLADTLVDTAIPDRPIYFGIGLITEAKARQAPAQKKVARPQPLTPGQLFGELGIDDDPAVAANATDVLIRAEVVTLDRAHTRIAAANTAKNTAVLDQAKSPDPTIRIKAIDDASQTWGLEDVVFNGLGDPDASVRGESIRVIAGALSKSPPNGPAALIKVLDMSQTDPARQVRHAVPELFMTMSDRGAIAALMPRLRLLACSHQEKDRAMAARIYGEVADPNQPISTNGRKADSEQYMQVTHLLDDPSPRVRQAAEISLTKFVRASEPRAPVVQVILKCLADTSSLDPDAKAAMLEVVPELAGHGVTELLKNPDPDIAIAAELGAEQRTGLPVARNRRVGTADAIKAVTSPVHSLRQMAAQSLLIQDPTDPTRETQGVTALLLAKDDSQDPIAIDALDTLVLTFCGPRIGPGARTFKEYQTQQMHMTVTHLPTPYEIAVQKLMDRTVTGSIQDRLAAIQEVAAGGPKLVAARWDVFVQLLDDDDPQIRASALAVARKVATQAIVQQLPAAAAAAGQK